MKKPLAVALAALVPLLAACSSAPTRRAQAEAKWTNEFVFLGLAALNVYTVAALADPVVLNTWEFYSRAGAASPRVTQGFKAGEAVASLTFDAQKPSIRLAQRFEGGPEQVLELRPIKEGVAGLDDAGRIILYSRWVEGRIVVTDNEARFIRVYEPEEAAALGRRHNWGAGR